MNKTNNKKLYENIMRDVSKIVKKHINESKKVNKRLNEAKDAAWENQYTIHLMVWIDNTVNNDSVIKRITERYADSSDAGYALACGMMWKLEAGGMDMIVNSNYDKFVKWLITSLARGFDMKVNSEMSEELVSAVTTNYNEVKDSFLETLMEEAYNFLPVSSEEEAQEESESGEWYYVCMCDSNGEWNEI